ncbi:MAG: PQQ-dependent sugar dehydrogenase [Acidobacteriota bacterium]
MTPHAPVPRAFRRSSLRFPLLALGLALVGSFGPAAPMQAIPATPVITEPAFDNQRISAFDVHMVAAPFVGAPGESHVCSDWEIQDTLTSQAVWTASCVTGTLKVHIHLGDGQFAGALAGHHELNAGAAYKLRVRFLGDADPPGTDWSDWAARLFMTSPASVVQPLVLSDVSVIPTPRWQDELGGDVVLPAGDPAPTLVLEIVDAGVLLELAGSDGATNRVENPPALAAHGPVHVSCTAGSASLSLPASRVTFTDGSGQDRELDLPSITLAPGGAIGFWIGVSGGAFPGNAVEAPGAAPVFATPVSASPIPWAVLQPGYKIDRFATNFQLPVNVAFVPNPGTGPDDPFFYVTELYGTIQMVTRSGHVSEYATGLLNFNPTGNFPGSGEMGLTGIVVEPLSGDVFASAVEEIPPEVNNHFPRVMRFHSTDGGRTAASQTTILDFPTEPMGPSHQISNLSIGPDGKLYVHLGDGLSTATAQDLTSARGKILRVNFDGSAPSDNSFYDASDGLTVTDLVYAYGFRNPFGGAWREADGAHWEVENGPSQDRLAKVVAGRNYRWDGSDASMHNFATYVWPVSPAPVNIAFTQPGTFGGSHFPAEKMDQAFVSESGPTYGNGPQPLGKRISEFVFDAGGALVSGPLPLIEYFGAGRATVTALAAGPDGLYFADLYKDFGAATPIDRGANVFRIRYTGVADFSADGTAVVAGSSVAFQDLSQVPSPAAWHWEFGDGAASDEHNPVHAYLVAGTYDVRLTVTGEGGEAPRQKAAFIMVQPASRALERPQSSRSAPHPVPPRP